MTQAGDFSNRMVAAMALTEPTLDTGVGSITRKIFDAVGEVAAAVTADSHLLNYTFDINSKSGADLDDFLLMFGFLRFTATRSIGTVTFTRATASTQDFRIPQGTTVLTGVAPTISFQTTAPAFLAVGTTSVQVPIQCVLAGAAGNLTARSITALGSALAGVSPTPTNTTATTGGAAPESDAAFRDRWKKTVFRSLSGTMDQFAALALANNADPTAAQSSAVVVFGASSRWKEQVQILSATATSSIPAANVRYIFPNSSVVGRDVENGQILTPGVHYTFNPTTPPTITVLSGSLAEGDFVDLDFEYCSLASRNDPVNGITNRVDVWVGGQRLLQASETTYFRTSTPFVAAAGGPYQNTNYVRLDSANVAPTVGNFFLPLGFGPIVAFPNNLLITSTNYVENVDYWVVHDRTASGYGPTSLFGLEWLASRALPVNTPIPLSGNNTYTYNALPSDIENKVTTQKLVTTDARAHAAKQVYIRINIAVMADYGTNRDALAASIRTNTAQWLSTKGFNSILQVSDVLQQIHSIIGVDNVRLITSTEPPIPVFGTYGIEQVSSTGTHLSNYSNAAGRTVDVQFSDNEVLVLQNVLMVFKAANSFGVS